MQLTNNKYWNFFRDYFEYFLVYGVFGWIYESIWCCMIYHRRGFVNRGFLFGPWLPIYGFGFFIVMAIFRLLKVKKPVWVFVVGTIVATTAELIASYIIDAVVGTPMWDYHGYFMNFDGRIALQPTLMFGLIICIALCLIQPGVVKLQEKFRESKIHNIGFIVIAILFFIDLVCRIWLGSNFVGYKEDTVTMNKEAYHVIADQVGIPSDRQWFIDEPEKYFNDKSEQFMERFIDEYDEDTTIWIGLVDEAILADKAWEFDVNTELGDFVWGLEKILPEELSINEELFDEDEYIGVWSADLNKEWGNEGYTLADLDIESDCYVIFVCKKDVFEQLKTKAAEVGHRIDLPENM